MQLDVETVEGNGECAGVVGRVESAWRVEIVWGRMEGKEKHDVREECVAGV